MTFQPLTRHAGSKPTQGLAVSAAVAANRDGGLRFSYRITDPTRSLLIPAPQGSAPTDGLWQHTCCEAFIAAGDGPEYREFNFSPSTRWAAYGFADYRQRCELSFAAAPDIRWQAAADGFQLAADIPADWLPNGEHLKIGLTAVLETVGGEKSYWALAHAGPQPDFHLRASFTLPLDRP